MSQRPFILRLRSPSGMFRVDTLSATSTLSDLLTSITSLTSISPECIRIKFGYPPKVVNLDNESATLQEIGILTGEGLTIEQGPARARRSASSASSGSGSGSVDHDGDSPMRDNPPPPSVGAVVAAGVGGALPPFVSEIPAIPAGQVGLTDTGFFLRRFVKADNSCLFNSVSYGLEGVASRANRRARGMRKLICWMVKKYPGTYTHAMLGKLPGTYCSFMMRDESWGGEIELSILSRYYKIRIIAFDIQTTNMYTYSPDPAEVGGEVNKMIMVLYDGIHYDPMALNLVSDEESAPEDFDIALFNIRDQRVLRMAKVVVAKLNRQHKYTDLSAFTVKCLQCNTGFVGHKDVAKHSQETGHTNFAEIAHS